MKRIHLEWANGTREVLDLADDCSPFMMAIPRRAPGGEIADTLFIRRCVEPDFVTYDEVLHPSCETPKPSTP
jgi:hypothetical protein